MSLINRILQAVVCLSFLLLVFAMSLVGTFSSNQRLTQVLAGSGFYNTAAKSLSSLLISQLSGNEAIVGLAKNGIGQAVTPEVVKSTLQPSQISILEWLNSPNGPIALQLDLVQLRSKALSGIDDPRAKFEITKISPDSISLISPDSEDKTILDRLQYAKLIYTTASQAIPFLWVTISISILSLVIVNIRKGSRKITSPAYSLAFGSIVGLVMAFSANLLSANNLLISSDPSRLMDPLALGRVIVFLLSQTLPVFIAVGLASVLAIIIAKVVFRASDRAL